MDPMESARTVRPPLTDPFGRLITYLRVSVTDRCNLRCEYCMPSESPEWLERQGLLTYEEIGRLLDVAASHGVRKVRITGGEPLVRRDLVELVARLASIPGIADLAMTTNATLLERHAHALREAGLKRLNISLDSLHAERFNEITKSNSFEEVWAGLMAAIDAGFAPVKLNVVVIRGFNDDELVDFARLTARFPVIVRFIEYMPIGGDRDHWSRDRVVPSAEIRERIGAALGLEPDVDADQAPGPERRFVVQATGGKVGFITPVSDEFCAACNRMRLTADGKIRGCLMRDGEVDFRAALRAGCSDNDISRLLQLAVDRKPEKHLINSPDFEFSSFYTMNRLGG